MYVIQPIPIPSDCTGPVQFTNNKKKKKER